MNIVSKDEKIVYDSRNNKIETDNIDSFSDNDKIIITDKRIYIEKSEKNFITLNNKNINRVDHKVEREVTTKDLTIHGIIAICIGVIAIIVGIILDSNNSTSENQVALYLFSVVSIPLGILFILGSRKKEIYEKATLIIYYDKGEVQVNLQKQTLEEITEIRNIIFKNIRNNL